MGTGHRSASATHNARGRGLLPLILLTISALLVACTPMQAAHQTPTAIYSAAKAGPLANGESSGAKPASFPLYQWAGTVTSGSGLKLQRSCDTWALVPLNREMKTKLQALAGQKAVVWGSVNDASVLASRASVVKSAYSPKGPMSRMAAPAYPCDGVPEPLPPVPAPMAASSKPCRRARTR